MKISLLISGILFGVSFNIFCQQYFKEFGKIGPAELELQQYEKDPEAEAVVLYDEGESYFFEKNEGSYIKLYIKFTRTKRIKILDNAGVKYAEVTIPYYSDGFGATEKVSSIEAFSYNFDDSGLIKTEVDKNAVYEEKVNERWNIKKFAFPNVKKGTIIEYKYVLETPFQFNLPDWEFQDRIPTLHSKYIVKLTPFYEYVFITQGISKFDYYNTELSMNERVFRIVNGRGFKDMVHTYVMKDVPAFKDEAYITSANDYIMKLDFQLSKYHNPSGGTREIISTWSALNKDLLKHDNIGKYIKKSGRHAGKLLESELDLEHLDDLEKAKHIIEYVKKSFRWNGIRSIYASEKPKSFINNKIGNIADLNLFLIAMLNEAGIEAHPVIISTRDHRKIYGKYPFKNFFNYVLVLVSAGDKSFLTDASEIMLSYNRIPMRCINDRGLALREDEFLWIDLYNNLLSLDAKKIIIEVDTATMTANVRVNSQSTEFISYSHKTKFLNNASKIEKELTENGLYDIKNLSTINYDKPHLPYVINFEGTANVVQIGNKIAVSQFLEFPIQKNKLTQKTRSYPVDMVFAQSKSLSSTVAIPEGYKIVNVPEPFEVENDLATVKLIFETTDKVVNANAVYSFKKAVYEPHEYARIKYYIDNIVKRFNEQVVFEKIEN